jgi:septal ring factor EnvC (AmiA/AmiB activator)
VTESATPPLTEVPTKRAVWRIALTAVAGTTAVIALVLGGYLLYDAKATEISDLKQQRQDLSATNETLSAENETLGAENETLNGQLASTRTELRNTDAKLTKTTAKLEATKKDLHKMKGDVAAANERAVANYSSGYGAGNVDGYSDGRDAGVEEASDELTCSDDADAGLPPCNFYDW